jgi:phage gp29-like protein
MKTATKEQISQLISYYNNSAYANVKDINELANELIEENDELDEVESSLFDDIDQALEGYKYIECEGQLRHIWHS